jgi:hypothetical protein
MHATAGKQQPIRGSVRARLLELRRRSDLLLYAPLGIAAIYALALLVNAGEVIGWVYLDGDAASAMVIAELIDDAPPERTVYFSNYPWYETLWFMQATRGLPAHREIWEAGPIVAAFAAFAALSWSAYRTLGPWAAATVLALLVCMGAFARSTFFMPNAHGHTAVHVVILAVAFVWAVRRADRWSPWGLGALALGLGLVTAPGVASDRLMVVAGVAPLLLGAVALPFLLQGRAYVRLAASFLAASLIAVGLGRVITNAMEEDRVEPFDFKVNFLADGDLFLNMELFVRGLANLAGGDFFGAPVRPGTVLDFTRASLVLIAFGVALVLVRRWTRTLRREQEPTPPRAAQIAYTLFWGLALLGPIAAFLISDAPVDDNSGRYLITSYMAAAALLPLAAAGGSWRRWAVVAGASVFAVVGTWKLVDNPAPNNSGFVGGKDVAALQDFARSEGLQRGYGDFWTAANVTWASRLDLEVFPLRACNTTRRYCRHNVHVITTWYDPKPGKSFLLVDSRQQRDVSGPDPSHGDPLEVRTFGQLTAYVYPYDIASRLAPPPP